MATRTIQIFFLAVFAMAICPDQAQAYLDPGTGNLFVYLVVSLLGTAAFILKGFGYKILKLMKDTTPGDAKSGGHDELVIFSEGKTYWYTFKPIIEALLEKGRPFTYLSMDIEDPALTIENKLMASRYIGQGSAAFARIAGFRTKVMLATTPNIGTPGYPLPRPTSVGCLAHVCHGTGGVDLYFRHSVDCYDAVLLASDIFEPSVRKLETLRGLPAKECPALGLPMMDELSKQVKAAKKEEPVEKDGRRVILMAPSWGEKGLLALDGGQQMISLLLEAGHRVIFRPHPHSFKVELALLEEVFATYQNREGFEIDRELDSSRSMLRADLLITDKSSVRFQFAFLYQKPVVTIDFPCFREGNYEAADLGYAWEDEVSAKIGPVAGKDDLGGIVVLAEQGLAWNKADLSSLRNSCLNNFGCAGPVIADWLIEKCDALAARTV